MGQAQLMMVVAGDELYGAENVRLALSNAGYKTSIEYGWSVKSRLSQQHPALIILILSGTFSVDVELCRAVTRLSSAPVIAIGGCTSLDSMLAMFEAGVTDCVARPVRPNEFVSRVRNILSRTQPKAAPGSSRSLCIQAEPVPSPKSGILAGWFLRLFKRPYQRS